MSNDHGLCCFFGCARAAVEYSHDLEGWVCPDHVNAGPEEDSSAAYRGYDAMKAQRDALEARVDRLRCDIRNLIVANETFHPGERYMALRILEEDDAAAVKECEDDV